MGITRAPLARLNAVLPRAPPLSQPNLNRTILLGALSTSRDQIWSILAVQTGFKARVDRKSGTMAQHTPPPRGSKARVEPEAEPKEDGEVGETIGDVLMRHGHELTGKLGAIGVSSRHDEPRHLRIL